MRQIGLALLPRAKTCLNKNSHGSKKHPWLQRSLNYICAILNFEIRMLFTLILKYQTILSVSSGNMFQERLLEAV